MKATSSFKTISPLALALLLAAPLCAKNAPSREIESRISAGKIQQSRGQKQKAKSLWEGALRLATAQIKAAPTSENLEKRAQILSLLGREKEAGADLSRAIELEIKKPRPAFKPSEEFAVGAPPDPEKFNARLVKLYLTRAQSRQTRGENDLALEDFQAVLRLDGENEVAKKGVELLAPQPLATPIAG